MVGVIPIRHLVTLSLARSLDYDIAALDRRMAAGFISQDRSYMFSAEHTRLQGEQARQLETAERDNARYGLVLRPCRKLA